MIKLRNPAGKTRWNGDWSRTDPRWTKKLRRLVEYEDNDEKVVIMTWSDYCEYFLDYQICYYYDNYFYNGVKLITETNQNLVLSFQVNNEGKYFLSLN